ncbi:MAG: PH domain-containing protein [Candidatus Saccharibacteria bacterium]|nr:PH domain-containing protein [Candidatus Saccharibacteria bacterium]
MSHSPEHQMSEHQLQEASHLSGIAKRLFKYIEFDDDEMMIREVRKHPIGLLFTWITGIFVLFVIMGITFFLSSQVKNVDSVNDSNGAIQTIILFVGLVLSLLSVVATAISAWLYTSNVLYVTSEKIAEVRYLSIFNRRVTQLNIGKVEDLTVNQRGILPRIFNYGNILIETAGETTNPDFTYVPMPNDVSKSILQAHENYVEKYGN